MHDYYFTFHNLSSDEFFFWYIMLFDLKRKSFLLGLLIFNITLYKNVSLFCCFRQGDLRVIRPFVYVREADLRAFAEQVRKNIILHWPFNLKTVAV